MTDSARRVYSDDPTPEGQLLGAIERGDVEEVRRRIADGASLSFVDDCGAGPVGVAARTGNTQMVALLLDRGVDIDASDDDGCTALIDAVRLQDSAMVDLLLERRADVNRTCIIGTALDMARQAESGKK